MSEATATHPRPSLSDPVTCLKGIGDERAVLLSKLGVQTVGDLLMLSPRRYEDRRKMVPIRDLVAGEKQAARGRVVAMGRKFMRQRSRNLFEIVLDDGTGRLHCRWWNAAFIDRLFKVGDEVLVFGKCLSLRPRTIDHPETETFDATEDLSLHMGRIVPVYPLTEGLGQRSLRSWVWQALQSHGTLIDEPEPAVIPLRDASTPAEQEAPVTDLQVAVAAASIRWPARREAIRALHFPTTTEETELGRRRLALDEFVALQWEIQRRRRALELHAQPIPCRGDNRHIRPFLASLPFKLTDAQKEVLKEIRTDLGGTVPMRRLLQGDVGAGKTVVAACAILMSIESGRTAALMAPTEILAEQHWSNFKRWFEHLGLEVALRTGAQRQGTEANAALTIGTHALIQSSAIFENLGLVVIDEQHKFGVAQREALVRKGAYPHLLVMTATPIPRTLGLTLYGDLDVSTLAHAPEGRGRVRTHVREPAALPRVWDFVRAEIAKGRQAYVVYPRVLESDHDDVKAVTRELKNLRAALAPHRVEMLHGKMSGPDKDAVMQAFRSGDVHVLLSTSVIEVGVDVPNATVMVIENAELFGLAQLHQLRGRIGRGGNDGHCILVSKSPTDGTHERLQTLARTHDGFEIAEVDLKLRGPGELTGREQSGLPPFRFGDLVQDRELVILARERVREAMRFQRHAS